MKRSQMALALGACWVLVETASLRGVVEPPSIGWMTGNAHMDNASGAEFEDDKDEQGAKEHIGDLNEITCSENYAETFSKFGSVDEPGGGDAGI
jgi:hypothetical protein